MMFDFSNARIFLRPGTTDMRTSKEELLHVINDLMEQDPFSGAVFMFCNSQRKLLKLILWETNGFWIAQITFDGIFDGSRKESRNRISNLQMFVPSFPAENIIIGESLQSCPLTR